MRLRLFVLVALLIFSGTAFAQGGALNYGDSQIGELTATSPLGFYTFNGTQGDRVSVQVIGVGIDPAVSLNLPTQQQLANNDNDSASPGTTDARVSTILPQSGVYTVLVSSVTGAPGPYLIRLSGQSPPVTQALTTGALLADLVPGGQAQVFTFNADPAAPTTLNISAITPNFNFGAVIYDASGQIVALVTQSTAFTYTLPPGDAAYTVEVTPSDPASSGQVSIGLGAAAAVVPAPVVTEEAAVPPAPVDSPDVCMVAAQGSAAVNVRSGPGVDFAAIAQLEPGTRLAVTGVSGTWYRVDVPGVGAGWVRRDVVTGFGPCDSVPQVDGGQVAPPVVTEEIAPAQITATLVQNGVAPVQEATATYTPATAQEQQVIEATPTYTPTTAQQTTSTYTPTATYTPSPTPTVPVPTAPPDANFNSPLTIPLDSTASVTDFVSYPGGDREDRVRWDINGMNPNSSLSGGRAQLIVAVSCFGTGTQNITFFTGGQTYSCGQTIVDREVTYDSRTGQVTITAVAGENTYVQWVLTGTATRVN